MVAGPATVSVEGLGSLREVHVALHAVALVVFLPGAVRMQQARKARHWVCLGWGFGLMLVVLGYEQALVYGLIELRYWSGMERDVLGEYVSGPAWWEAFAWWGSWALRLSGHALVALGFFWAAREVVREALFGGGPKRRKGAKA